VTLSSSDGAVPDGAASDGAASDGAASDQALPAAGDDVVVLPPAVRARAVALAAAALNDAPADQVPTGLRAVRRFTPAKRTRLGGAALALALESDESFRSLVADHVSGAEPELVAALHDGSIPPAANPVELAALAYLVRAPRWPSLVASAEQEAVARAASGDRGELDRLRTELAVVKAAARDDVARLRGELADARHDAEDSRRRLRSAETAGQRGAAELAAVRDEAANMLAVVQTAAGQAAREAEAEQRRLRLRLADAETALSSARRSIREARGTDSVRLRVLLDTLLSAAAGLRRELDLPPVVERPADSAIGAGNLVVDDPLAAVFAARGQSPADPALVDAVLAAPGLHLLVDGYNVTKSGYPDSTLEAQRNRLLAGLGALAARHPETEFTCVFDGTAATTRPTAVPVPRGVRVLFSAVGELADELLIRLVHAEPPGRPLVVVTNDREIITGAAAAGARPVPSEALLARLERA
jgi:predicted RNA-binding protein with PIN domain